MAVRSDISVIWALSPRIIEVAAPSTEVTIQDLVDTLRTLESELGALDDDYLIDAFGKEELGGGVYVAVTLQLQNAKLRFQARSGPEWVACKVSGGNLVALDLLGDPMDPIAPSAYVTVTYAQAVSAALVDVEIDPWAEEIPASYPIGSAGYLVGNNLDAKVSTRLPTAGYTAPDNTGIAAIQNLAAFVGGAVWIDTVNGAAGTAFPLGTQRVPVNNFPDALTIAQANSLTQFQVLGYLYIADIEAEEVDVSGYRFSGFGAMQSYVSLGWYVLGAELSVFSNLMIEGYVGGSQITCFDCEIPYLADPNGYFFNCVVGELAAARDVYLFNCSSLSYAQPSEPWFSAAVISCYSSKQIVAHGCQGVWELAAQSKAYGKPEPHSLFSFRSGTLAVGSACASGTVDVEGDCAVTVDPGAHCTVNDRTLSGTHGAGSWEDTAPADIADAVDTKLTGTHGAGSWVDSGAAPTPEEVATAVVDKDVGGETVGELLSRLPTIESMTTFLREWVGGQWEIKNNQMIFYNTATPPVEILRFDLFDAQGDPGMTDVYKRVPT